MEKSGRIYVSTTRSSDHLSDNQSEFVNDREKTRHGCSDLWDATLGVTRRKPPCSLKQKQQNVSAAEGIPATQTIALTATYEAPPPLLYDLLDISSDEMGSVDEQNRTEDQLFWSNRRGACFDFKSGKGGYN